MALNFWCSSGGDGTARDIYDGIDSQVPVVAVPSGVKIFSAVFAVSARAAANMVDAFLSGYKKIYRSRN